MKRDIPVIAHRCVNHHLGLRAGTDTQERGQEKGVEHKEIEL